MSGFKVGDKIIGITDNYLITNDCSICEVVQVFDDKGIVKVKVIEIVKDIDSESRKQDTLDAIERKSSFSVEARCFKLYISPSEKKLSEQNKMIALLAKASVVSSTDITNEVLNSFNKTIQDIFLSMQKEIINEKLISNTDFLED